MVMAEYPTRRDPVHVVAAIVIVAAVVVAGIVIVATPPATDRPQLIVYTYDSFMVWGADPANIDDEAFGQFEEIFNVDVRIERLTTDAKGIVTRLGAESANPVADVVIGIDNILILQEGVTDLLTPFEPYNLPVINQSIIDALDPDHYVTPFDFGLVTLIYNTSKIDVETHPELLNLTLDDISSTGLASSLVTENPNLSSPGLAFLLTTIAYQEKILGETWTDWWNDVKNDINVQPGWSEAWGVWSTNPSRAILNSYSTDPAYSAYWSGSEPNTAVAPLYHDGEYFAWMQVEGIGLVKNGPNPDLGKRFIEYCLNPTVQDRIAINQWMLPVRNGVTLDPSFRYAMQLDEVTLLNELLTRAEIATSLSSWLTEYDNIMTL
jgi:thiamine transport system substrate-binding protein